MMTKLDGYKTYIVIAGAILTALGAYLTGELTLMEFVNASLVSLGIGTVRHGMKTGAK